MFVLVNGHAVDGAARHVTSPGGVSEIGKAPYEPAADSSVIWNLSCNFYHINSQLGESARPAPHMALRGCICTPVQVEAPLKCATGKGR